MKKQINFCGSQSTGKTTMLNMLKTFLPKDEYSFKTEVVRSLIKERGIDINESGGELSQDLIFNAYLNFLVEHRNENYVSDRCAIDPLAYSLWLYRKGKLSKSIINFQIDIVESAVKNGYLTEVYYFPIEFEIVDDGTRSIDKQFQRDIDDIFGEILSDLARKFKNFNVIKVSGTPMERVEKILKNIGQ